MELVNVEEAPSVHFAPHGGKINILELLPVLELGNLVWMGSINNSELSPIMNRSLESHNSALVELRDERYLLPGKLKDEELESAIRLVYFLTGKTQLSS